MIPAPAVSRTNPQGSSGLPPPRAARDDGRPRTRERTQLDGRDQRRAFRCCGVRIDALPLEAAVDTLVGWAGTGRAVHLCNAYTLSLARGDDAYRALLDRGDLNLPDGMPLLWIARRLGVGLEHGRRPRGTDVFTGTVVRGRGLRHYLYGSTSEVVATLAERIAELGAVVAGAESPPFRDLTQEEESALVDRVRGAGASIVWVGLGTPRQDAFVDAFRDRLGAPLVAVGAAFDFLAGSKPQAPAWMQRTGLEWLHRLGSEPRRLWKRYLVGNARFAAGALRGTRLEGR